MRRLVLIFIAAIAATPCAAEEMANGFVYLRDVDPTILQDMRYAGTDNFTGHAVNGYDAPECVLVREAAEALKAVQEEVKAKGLSLKVYDCYRPARAVKAFVDWSKLPDDAKAKATYYPALSKSALFPDYIALVSGHSRGATMDLTLVPLDAPAVPPSASSGEAMACTAARRAAGAGREPGHGHGLRLLRREGQYGEFQASRRSSGRIAKCWSM